MGYRSDVAFSIEAEVLKRELESLKESNPELSQALTTLFEESDIHLRKDGWSLYIWEQYSWNDEIGEREDLCWIRSFMERREEEIDNIDDLPFRFVRLGDNFMDNEVLGTYNEPFRIGYVKELMYKGEHGETIH